jgi:succinate dehydrogenase/fumarate reductase flavoprotein subunit
VKIPRFLHCVYAFLNGYFWLPCPLCGRKFGGHEYKVSWMVTHSYGHGVCPNCEDAAHKHNEELFKNIPPMRMKL